MMLAGARAALALVAPLMAATARGLSMSTWRLIVTGCQVFHTARII